MFEGCGTRHAALAPARLRLGGRGGREPSARGVGRPRVCRGQVRAVEAGAQAGEALPQDYADVGPKEDDGRTAGVILHPTSLEGTGKGDTRDTQHAA